MVKAKDETLRREVGRLYSFASIVYPDVMSSMQQRKGKKPKGIEEERLFEHIKKEISKSVKNYFSDFKIDEKMFDGFDQKKRKHLVGLGKNINEVEKETTDDILEEFFTPLSKGKTLDSVIGKILNIKNNSIESINRQIGYSMVLYTYENKGYKKYRLNPSSTACEACIEKSQHTYLINKLSDVEFLPLVHPNCRCIVEILDDKNKGIATIDGYAIEEQLKTKDSTKEIGFLDYVSALLSAAALVPGLDTFVNIASIPVDLLRGDLLSAGFDLLGIIPVVGEVGDVGKALRIADKISDASKVAKTTDKVVDGAKIAERSKKGTKLLSKVSNTRLKNTIKEMYRPGAKIGDGGLADAIIHEIRTKELVGGKSHIQKGKERLKNLENILKKENLTKDDKEIVEELIKELQNALGGRK